MRRIVLFLVCASISLFIYGQSISVSSFKLLDSDLTANTAGTIEKDQNGETAALIKVVTTQTGFSFDGGALGIVKTVQKPSEIWVYVPRGLKKITISHPQLGILRDYYLKIPIESARTYEMILVTGIIETIVRQDIGAQYFVLTVEPKNASVFIDDREMTVKDGGVSKLLNYGEHTYRVSAPLFHAEAGVFVINQEKKEISIRLKPNYGIISVNTTPEMGASVYLDNETESIGKTPINTNVLSEGEHTIKVRLNGYYSQTVKHKVIGDGSTQELSITMKPSFGVVKAIVPNGCTLFVDDETKDVRSWDGRLEEGVHMLEARRDNHRSIPQKIEMEAGQILEIILPDPTPIMGSLDLSTTPINALIVIDGEEYGKTPNLINNLLVGEHVVELRLNGYDTVHEKVMIEEKGVVTKSFKMEVDTNVGEKIKRLNCVYLCDATNRKGMGIQKIEKTEKSTILHMVIALSSDNWISIKPETYLQLPSLSANNKLKLISANGIEYSPQKTLLKSGEIYKFDLIFPAIPDDVDAFDLIEPGGWKFYGIKLTDIKANLSNKKNVEIKTNLNNGGAFYVDGKYVGNVDERFFEIEPGIHTLKVAYGGYEDLEKSVNVQKKGNLFKFNLKKRKGVKWGK